MENNDSDLKNQLGQERVIFLGDAIDNDVANSIVSQLLFLEAEDSEKDIYLYINSPGGSVSVGMAIIDVMNHVNPDVCTVCMGLAGGMAAIILSVGAKGKRMSLSSSRLILTEVVGGSTDKFTDGFALSQEKRYLRDKIQELLSIATGQPLAKIQADNNRDFCLSAAEAKAYGLIDTVIEQ